jgi:hypothetical protein
MSVALANCDEFNVIRAFNIIALIICGLVVIPQIIYAFAKTAASRKWAKNTAVAMALAAGTFIISLSLILVGGELMLECDEWMLRYLWYDINGRSIGLL